MMKKLTVSVVAFALAVAFLAFTGTPALGAEVTVGPTVTATAETLGIKLEWTFPENAGAVGFVIHRGVASGRQDRWPVADFPATGNFWLDKDVTPGTTYYYVVVPLMKDGSRGYDSIEVSATAVSLASATPTSMVIRTAAGAVFTPASQPLLSQGRVLLTVADLVALTGADLQQYGKAVTHKLPSGRVMNLEVGSPRLVFAKAVRTDTCAPVEVNGQVYLPLRWIVEAMEGTVTFNPVDWSVTVDMGR